MSSDSIGHNNHDSDTSMKSDSDIPTTGNDSQRHEVHPAAPRHVLQRIPNTAFGVPLGLAGNAILWKSLQGGTFDPDKTYTNVLNAVMWVLALLTCLVVTFLYFFKCIFHRGLVLQEYRDPSRLHFLNAPHLLLILLALGLPTELNPASTMPLRVVFGIALVAQILSNQHIYEKWLFNPGSNISCAKPPFLLSTVGWFLLANLGVTIDIEEEWGLAIPQFCLGIGSMFYLIVVFVIMISLHKHRKEMKGSPALTLLLAPPSIGVVALDAIDGTPETFSIVASVTLGWILVLFIIFSKAGPMIVREPGVLGEYWAYVFPLAAVATAFARYAAIVETLAADVLASIFIGIAGLTLLTVVWRMIFHTAKCIVQKARWGDPLLKIRSSVILPSPSTTPDDAV